MVLIPAGQEAGCKSVNLRWVTPVGLRACLADRDGAKWQVQERVDAVAGLYSLLSGASVSYLLFMLV